MEYVSKGVEVINILNESGHEAFFVGGFVRDYLLGIKPNDIDIATNALPNQIANLFEVVNTGIKYNSVTVIYEGYSYELTTYRVDLSYSDNRHPVYKVANSLAEDLRRRDFTINAMAMDSEFKVVDNFDGKEDLDNRVIRTVFDPIKRFTEDALRMLRACYFAAKLDFNIEENTLNGIKKCSHLIQSLSSDRVLWELEKIINSNHPEVGLKYLKSSNILPYLTLFKDGINLILERGYKKLLWAEFLAICFYENVEKLNEIHLKTGVSKNVKEIIELAKKTPKNDYTMVDVFDYGYETCFASNIVNMYCKKVMDKSLLIEQNYLNLPIHSMAEIPFKGQDIIDSISPSNMKEIGEILQDIKEKILLGKLKNDKDNILEYTMKYYGKNRYKNKKK